MSRAFTKEDDAGEDLPELPIPSGPNYVTPRGLELLKETVVGLIQRKKSALSGEDLRPVERDLRYVEARITSAMVVPLGSGDEIRFGATVTFEDEQGRSKTFRIVGDDEARTDTALISWSAPLAFTMLGAKTGDTVTWDSPDGATRFRIVSVRYLPSV